MRVRPCFFVNVRKARGRRVAGGRRTGRTVAGRMAAGAVMASSERFCGTRACTAPVAAVVWPVRRGLRGWRGVPKPGEEEGIGLASVLISVVMAVDNLFCEAQGVNF